MLDRRYRNRSDAGRALAAELGYLRRRSGVIVLALPRGGVPVAAEVAAVLELPLDVFLVRKLGVPGHEELAMGAIATGGVRVLNQGVVDTLGIGAPVIDRVAVQEQAELERREREYRGARPEPELRGRHVVLVDDGLATGSTMRAAAAAVLRQGPFRVTVAVPVAAAETCADLGQQVDDVVCPLTPDPFHAVGLWYADFTQTTDEEVRVLLARARERHDPPRGAASGEPVDDGDGR